MKIELQIEKLIFPLFFIAAGFLIGFVLDKIILSRFKKIAANTKWEGDDIIASALKGMFTLWFSLISIYIVIFSTPIQPTVIKFLQKLIGTVVIASLTIVISRISVGFVNLNLKKAEGVLPSTSILTNLVKLLVFIIGALIILQSVGISIAPILTALGVGGLAVALALQDTLSNLFSGLQILASKQIQPGDYIKLESSEEGYVTDITWRNTIIKALPNNIIVVPNSKLASTIITNYCLIEKEIAVLVQVGVSYESDLEKVEKITIEVAKETMQEIPGGIPEFLPFIRYHTFADFSINFSVIMRAKEFVDQYLIKHEFIKKLHKRYNQENIDIPFPIRTIYTKGQSK